MVIQPSLRRWAVITETKNVIHLSGEKKNTLKLNNIMAKSGYSFISEFYSSAI